MQRSHFNESTVIADVFAVVAAATVKMRLKINATQFYPFSV